MTQSGSGDAAPELAARVARAARAVGGWLGRVWTEPVVRFCAGVAALLAVVVVVSMSVAPQAEALSRLFVQRFGLWGLLLGTFLADGLHFPVPPQFYMLIGLTAATGALPALAAIALGSVLGGALAFGIARVLRSHRWGQRLAGHIPGAIRARAGRERPLRFVALSSLTPVPFAWLCYAIGFNQLPLRAFALLAALRVPKLLIYFAIVSAGWSLAAP